MNLQEAASGTQFAPSSPPANATPEELALWLADTRTRAHRLIDESVTAAQEMLNKRVSTIDEGDATAQAQRHAQRLAIERLRRAIGDLTLEIRGVHGRLDRLESLIRAALEASVTHPVPAEPVVAPRPAMRREAVPPEVSPTAALFTSTPEAAVPAAETPREPVVASTVAPSEQAGTLAPRAEQVPEPAMEKELAPPTGFAADARAAVEAAVASALQEARRAASLRAVPAQTDDEPEFTPPAAREEPTGRTDPAVSEPELATPVAQRDEPSPAASTQAAPTSAEPDDDAEPAPSISAEPAARPSLWVPPSAIAPRRPEPTPAERPAEESRSVVAASLPASAVPPAASGGAAAAVAAPVAAPPSASPVTSPFEGNPAAAAAAAAAVSRFAAATATATTERFAPGTFGPDGGPIVLRIAPISGFQGLMRVQDAVVQHPPVREATVEAYARGEARLRLQLASPLEAEQLSSALSRSLGLQARVESVSDDERSIQVTLA